MVFPGIAGVQNKKPEKFFPGSENVVGSIIRTLFNMSDLSLVIFLESFFLHLVHIVHRPFLISDEPNVLSVFYFKVDILLALIVAVKFSVFTILTRRRWFFHSDLLK